jgi:ketosteroid isomerase-like protein
MSRASPELRAPIEAAYAAVNRGDLDGFLAVLDKELEFTSLIAEAEGTTFRGLEGARAWWETVRGAFDEMAWELQDVRGGPDRGVARVKLTGRISGVPVEQTLWQAIVLRNGKAVWWENCRSEREALAAVNLDA